MGLRWFVLGPLVVVSAGALVSVRQLGDFAKEEAKINQWKTFAQGESVKSAVLAISAIGLKIDEAASATLLELLL